MKTRIDIYRVIQDHGGGDNILKYEWDNGDIEFYNDHWKEDGWIHDVKNFLCYRDFDGLILKQGDAVMIGLECSVKRVWFDTTIGMHVAILEES